MGHSSVRRVVVATAAAVALILSIAGVSPAQAETTTPAVDTSEFIVTLGPGGSVAAALDDLLTQLGAGQVLDTYEHALRGGLIELPDALGTVLATLPAVTGVERNAPISLATDSWGTDRIDQRQLPLDDAYSPAGNGAGVSAYVIDTGIQGDHAAFGSRVANGFSSTGANPKTDCNGHGTHVAGTVGGDGFGVATGVTLIPVQVLDCDGSGTNAGVIAGIDWAASHHLSGPAVANMSLGGGASGAIDDAVEGLVADGVTTAVAAGNESTDACNTSPARTEAAITVAASTINDGIASYSNFGPCVDVFAPGSSIVSATPDGGSTALNGTSMASPHVAGVAALVTAANPGWSPAQVSADIVDWATPGVVNGIKTNCTILDNLLGSCMSRTPNLLLYTGTEPPGTEPPPLPPEPCSPLEQLLGLC